MSQLFGFQINRKEGDQVALIEVASAVEAVEEAFEVLGSSAIYILPTLLVFHRIWILIRFAHLTWLRFYVCSWRPLPFLSVAP